MGTTRRCFWRYGRSEDATKHETDVPDLNVFAALVHYRDLDGRLCNPQFSAGGALLRFGHYSDFRTEEFSPKPSADWDEGRQYEPCNDCGNDCGNDGMFQQWHGLPPSEISTLQLTRHASSDADDGHLLRTCSAPAPHVCIAIACQIIVPICSAASMRWPSATWAYPAVVRWRRCPRSLPTRGLLKNLISVRGVCNIRQRSSGSQFGVCGHDGRTAEASRRLETPRWPTEWQEERWRAA